MMKFLSKILLGFVALSHFGFFVLETFLWTKPVGMQVFDLTAEFAAQSAVLAANQGVYNALLAAGLLWALFTDRLDLKVFFLGFVIVAGIYGGFTASTSILFIQATPAIITLLLVWLSKPSKA
jgi:putative membrane protein